MKPTALPLDTKIIKLKPIIELDNGVHVRAFPNKLGSFELIIDGKVHDSQLNLIDFPIAADGRKLVIDSIQRFTNGDYFVCSLRAKDGEQNAFIFDKKLRLTKSFHIGDAIEKVLIDLDDYIWVGYFDEGVFGNNRLSRNGLNKFSKTGNLVVSVPGIVDDCKNLNIDFENNLYICPYSSNVVYKISYKKVETISDVPPLYSATGLMVFKDTIAKFGAGFDTNDPLGQLEDLDYMSFDTVTGQTTYGPMHSKLDPDRFEIFESCITILRINNSEKKLVRIFDETGKPISLWNCNLYQDVALIVSNSKVYQLKFRELLY